MRTLECEALIGQLSSSNNNGTMAQREKSVRDERVSLKYARVNELTVEKHVFSIFTGWLGYGAGLVWVYISTLKSPLGL